MGLSEIPSGCRLAEAVRNVLQLWRSGAVWEEALDHVMKKYGHYRPVHTINNAAIVTIALLWGKGRLPKSAAIAVMGGLDTDCNGTTAGSIAGVMIGASTIPAELSEPLNDTVRSLVAGFDGVKISWLAEKTLVYALKSLGASLSS